MPITAVYSICNQEKNIFEILSQQQQSPYMNFVQQDFVLIDSFFDVLAKDDRLLDRAFLQKFLFVYVFFFFSE